MKKILIYTVFAAGLIASAGCKKEYKYIDERTNVIGTGTSLLKINYLSAYALNPSVQLSVNGARVSGLIAGRTPFPGGGYNTNGSNYPDYLQVRTGANTVAVSIPKKNTSTDSVVLFTTSTTALKEGKNYTLHITDTLANTKAFLTEDDLTVPVYNNSSFKFVNMMPNAPLLDLYFNTTKVAGGIPYLGTSATFSVPVPTVAGTWSVRETGTSPTSTALATYSNISTTINQRIYTAFALGYKGATATNTKPYVSFLLNL